MTSCFVRASFRWIIEVGALGQDPSASRTMVLWMMNKLAQRKQHRPTGPPNLNVAEDIGDIVSLKISKFGLVRQ